MVKLQQSLALVLCLVHLPYLTSGFLRPSGVRKRLNKESRSKAKRIYSEISFKSKLPAVSIGQRHGSLVIDCEAQSIPAPTIHWLKNGVRLTQGYSNRVEDDAATYEDHTEQSGLKMISVSSTKSRLFLDCLNSRDAGLYTCVAETPYLKATRNTTVKVVKRDYDSYNEVSECMGRRSRKGEPARIFMWTVSRLEYEDVKVQLFCRAQGYPEPTVMWYDRDNQPIVNSRDYELLENGDLIVSSISWFKNMGVYTCVADNDFGTDTSITFLYPAARH